MPFISPPFAVWIGRRRGSGSVSGARCVSRPWRIRRRRRCRCRGVRRVGRQRRISRQRRIGRQRRKRLRRCRSGRRLQRGRRRQSRRRRLGRRGRRRWCDRGDGGRMGCRCPGRHCIGSAADGKATNTEKGYCYDNRIAKHFITVIKGRPHGRPLRFSSLRRRKDHRFRPTPARTWRSSPLLCPRPAQPAYARAYLEKLRSSCGGSIWLPRMV